MHILLVARLEQTRGDPRQPTWEAGPVGENEVGAQVDATRRTAEIEYEQMLLQRHALASINRKNLIERSAYILLSRIRVQGPMSISELSEALGLDASTLNRQTAAAMRAGLLERIPDPAGGIARKFVITDQGSQLLDSERELAIDGLDKLMAQWSDEEIAAYGAALKRFNMDIERHTGRIWPRP